MHFLRQLATDGTTDIHPGGAPASARLIEALALSAGQVVLELGCGPATTLVRIAATHEIRAIGIDLLPEMLRTASRRVRWSGLDRRVILLRGDAARLPIASGSCDRIYAESVVGIQDQDKLEPMLAEIHRALKPAGRCILNDAIWRSTTSDAQIDAANARCQEAFGLRQASESHWRADDWRSAIVRAGFRVLAQLPVAATATEPLGYRMPARAAIASHAVSLVQRTGAALRPSARHRKSTYGALLREHSDLGRMIESWMFVLERAP
jgi:SAM-dependent methyltransferase